MFRESGERHSGLFWCNCSYYRSTATGHSFDYLANSGYWVAEAQLNKLEKMVRLHAPNILLDGWLAFCFSDAGSFRALLDNSLGNRNRRSCVCRSWRDYCRLLRDCPPGIVRGLCVTLPLRQQWFAFGARQGQPHFFRQRRRNVSHVDQAQILSRRNSGADQEKGRA